MLIHCLLAKKRTHLNQSPNLNHHLDQPAPPLLRKDVQRAICDEQRA